MTVEPHEVPRAAVLFDLDGTLLDTPQAITRELINAVRQITGRTQPPELVASLVGRPLPMVCARLTGTSTDSPLTQQVIAAYRDAYRTRIIPAASDLVFPGVRSGLARLTEHGAALAVVTSKEHASAETILQAAGLGSWFRAVVGVDDTEHPKPHPASVRKAIALIGATPAATVMVGDTEHDILAGQAVPVSTVAVTYGVGLPSRLVRLRPTAVASTFDDAVTHSLMYARGDLGVRSEAAQRKEEMR